MTPEMTAICGRNATAAADVAGRFGWQSVETDWHARDHSARTSTSSTSAPRATRTPRSRSRRSRPGSTCSARSRSPTASPRPRRWPRPRPKAAESGVRSMVGFTYRRVPAIGLAQRLVAQGRIGTIRNVRAQYLQDWIVDPKAPLFWRLRKEVAGSGALGDIGAHIIDLVQYITGESITGPQRADRDLHQGTPAPGEHERPVGHRGHRDGRGDRRRRRGLHRPLSGGGLATFEATRFATGRKNAIRIEINGSEGSVAFDFEDMNILHFYDNNDDPEIAGFRRILVTEPVHPVRRELVAGGTPDRLRARLHPPGRRPGRVTSPTTATRGRRSPTACASNAFSTPSRRAPPATVPGWRSPRERSMDTGTAGQVQLRPLDGRMARCRRLRRCRSRRARSGRGRREACRPRRSRHHLPR